MKKFLTFVLVLAMVLSVSSFAMAAEKSVNTAAELIELLDGDGTNDAADGDTIRLTGDITTSETLVITKGVIIDGSKGTGGNFTLTYTGEDRAIDIPNGAGAAEVTIKNLTVDCNASYCQRGINYNATGKLTLDNVTVGGTNVTYALNIPGMAKDCEVTINGGSYTGCIAINVWGNSIIKVKGAKLTSVDNNAAEGYAAVMLNNDGETSAEGTVITITDGSIGRDGTYKDDSYATTNATSTGKINISNTTQVDGEQRRLVAVIRYPSGNSYSFTSIEDAVQYAEEKGENTIHLLTDDVDISSIQTNEDLTIVGADGTQYSTSNGTVGIIKYGVKVSPIKLDFGTKEAGYSGVIPQVITIEGATDIPIVTLPSADVSKYNCTVTAVAGATDKYTVTINPVDGLGAGNHDTSVTLNVESATNGTPYDVEPVKVFFTVTAPTSSGGYYGPNVWYIGGNTFGTNTNQVPTSVEIDGVPVSFTMNGSQITVGCIQPGSGWVTVRWGSVSNYRSFTPDANAYCAQAVIPKTGGMSIWAAIAQFLGF